MPKLLTEDELNEVIQAHQHDPAPKNIKALAGTQAGFVQLRNTPDQGWIYYQVIIAGATAMSLDADPEDRLELTAILAMDLEADGLHMVTQEQVSWLEQEGTLPVLCAACEAEELVRRFTIDPESFPGKPIAKKPNPFTLVVDNSK